MVWFILGLIAFSLTILAVIGLWWLGDKMFEDHKPPCLSAHDERIRDELVMRCDTYGPQR